MNAASLPELLAAIRECRACADLPQGPRPVVQAGEEARLLIISQAPGSKVHASGLPFDDDSGDRLRAWMGIDKTLFYDPAGIALIPAGFCYPGKGKGGDLPPRRECAPLWHDRLLSALPNIRLTLLVGQYAQKLYLPRGFAPNLTEAVRQWREAPGGLLPLPHPAWRSRLWMARNPWFEAEMLPDLRERVRQALSEI
ncbi:uracil-DNA glycosylase family protein [Novosphingobium sp.]|uniref:uracil-DNA glycosylase family protein n=1 Tax=Novosphingobium sp. TaxID=1874826 RepID=UPI0028AD4E96|nr:uracil-DNA glycosylase family protein [Novosphingobium sp.]